MFFIWLAPLNPIPTFTMPQYASTFAVLRHECVIPFLIYSIYSFDKETLKWLRCPGCFVLLQYLVLLAETGFCKPVQLTLSCDTLVKGSMSLSPNM